MKRKFVVILMVLALAMSLAACGGNEETTITGKVVSVDGTALTLMEMDSANMDGMSFSEGQRPEMPEGMGGFGDFDPGEMMGTMPESGSFPQWGEGDMPDGMTMPSGGEMPEFEGSMGGMAPNFGAFSENMETRTVDIANAHISVEIDGSKASGSMDDIKAGTFVTITMNSKGEVTNVLVSSQSFFGNGR